MIKSFEQTVFDGSNKTPDSGVLEVARQLDTINTEDDPIPENAIVFSLGASSLIVLIQGAISRSTTPGEYEFLEETYKDGHYGDAYTIAQELIATRLPEKREASQAVYDKMSDAWKTMIDTFYSSSPQSRDQRLNCLEQFGLNEGDRDALDVYKMEK